MKHKITLREATMDDADILLSWRNDPKTREASHNTDEVSKEEHRRWLEKTLDLKSRQLLIAEIEGCPVGTIRADYSDNYCELSWTINPKNRGQGIGKEMVFLAAQGIQSPLYAEIKPANIGSIKIAEFIGMNLTKKADDILYYTK